MINMKKNITIEGLKKPKVTGAVVVYKDDKVSNYIHVVGHGYVRDLFAYDVEKYLVSYERFLEMISKEEYSAKLYEGIMK